MYAVCVCLCTCVHVCDYIGHLGRAKDVTEEKCRFSGDTTQESVFIRSSQVILLYTSL